MVFTINVGGNRFFRRHVGGGRRGMRRLDGFEAHWSVAIVDAHIIAQKRMIRARKRGRERKDAFRIWEI